MSIIIKILINNGKLIIRVQKKKNKSIVQIEKPLKVRLDNTELMNDYILSRNLKHLSFINELEMSLNNVDSKNFIIFKELNYIKKAAQVNTLAYLNKHMN